MLLKLAFTLLRSLKLQCFTAKTSVPYYSNKGKQSYSEIFACKFMGIIFVPFPKKVTCSSNMRAETVEKCIFHKIYFFSFFPCRKVVISTKNSARIFFPFSFSRHTLTRFLSHKNRFRSFMNIQ